MKKIYNILIVLLVTAAFAACETDNDSNPTIVLPDSFVLNTPPTAEITTDLENSSMVEFTTSQPNYGYTAATTYAVQVSLTDTWNDEDGDTPATYETLETTSNQARVNASAEEINKGINRLSGWTSESDFDGNGMEVYIRLRATVSQFVDPVYSNSVKIKVLPYYVELSEALPEIWFITGDLAGAWNGDATTIKDIGTSLIPMATIKDYEYDKRDGTGEIKLTIYIPADTNFKIIKTPGSWADQWGNSGGDGINSPVKNDGGSGNFKVSETGWYEIKLNTKDDKLEITKIADYSGNDYQTMELVGTFEGWGDSPITATKADNPETRIWVCDVTFDADADTSVDDPEGCKFRTDANWANSWGGPTFPFGITPGDNIPYREGTYKAVLNLADECYQFFVIE